MARHRVYITSVFSLFVVDFPSGVAQEISGFEYASGVAVARNGDVLVADLGRNFFDATADEAIYRLDPGSFSRRLAANHPWVSPAHLDVDRDGMLLVLDSPAGPSTDSQTSSFRRMRIHVRRGLGSRPRSRRTGYRAVAVSGNAWNPRGHPGEASGFGRASPGPFHRGCFPRARALDPGVE
ncbi:MAG: hypothetical protein HY650_02130 [Acidobacteria bacterium]|nr:hypothetical protein [Acidobacteriota bacterium]